MALIDLFLRRAVRRGTLTLLRPDTAPVTFGLPDPAFPDVTLRFADRGVGRAIARHPTLAAGELFTDGRMTVEGGDILDLVRLMTANDAWEARAGNLAATPVRRMLGAVKYRLDRINMERRSHRNVAHHYDLSDRLYALFLDEDRQYSCAYYRDPADTLEAAQLAKKAHIAAKLACGPGMRVLDIGCGWGGMALYLHRHTGAEVLGVTLSQEQLKVARARAEAAGVADKVRFELIDYRRVQGSFDRIVSVGMFEHVGPPQYATFFRQCRRLLADDGVMLLHTIGRLGTPGVTDDWTAKYIFPGGYNPALSEIVRASEPTRLFLTDVEVLRLHYAYTLADWYRRTVAARGAIVALYDERFYRMWTFYLAGAVAAFENGALCNYQLQYSKARRTLPIVRDYMADGERRLLAADGAGTVAAAAGPLSAAPAASARAASAPRAARPG